MTRWSKNCINNGKSMPNDLALMWRKYLRITVRGNGVRRGLVRRWWKPPLPRQLK